MSNVLFFLVFLYECGFGYSFIIIDCFMLIFFDFGSIILVGNYVLVCRLMRGVFDIRLIMSCYFSVWDVKDILNFFR